MKFLSLEIVLDLHEEMIKKYGGLNGVRDLGLLKSAIEMPKSMMFGDYLHPSIYDKAAAYLYHITCNHPFFDGNKRTSSASALVFLALNDVELTIEPKKYEELVIEVAQGKADKKKIAEFFKEKLHGESNRVDANQLSLRE